jgi:hypothetical protein
MPARFSFCLHSRAVPRQIVIRATAAGDRCVVRARQGQVAQAGGSQERRRLSGAHPRYFVISKATEPDDRVFTNVTGK